MYHLRNLICRNLVPAEPEKNMNAAEDFMLLLVHTHVKDPVKEMAKSIVCNFTSNAIADSDDTIHLYATELQFLGLLWHGFHDALRESDGKRILHYWKLLLVLLRFSSHRNYAKEAVNLLFQYHYVFYDGQKAQLLWSRCVYTIEVEKAQTFHAIYTWSIWTVGLRQLYEVWCQM